jgi:hypothetical protein
MTAALRIKGLGLIERPHAALESAQGDAVRSYCGAHLFESIRREARLT